MARSVPVRRSPLHPPLHVTQFYCILPTFVYNDLCINIRTRIIFTSAMQYISVPGIQIQYRSDSKSSLHLASSFLHFFYLSLSLSSSSSCERARARRECSCHSSREMSALFITTHDFDFSDSQLSVGHGTKQ